MTDEEFVDERTTEWDKEMDRQARLECLRLAVDACAKDSRFIEQKAPDIVKAAHLFYQWRNGEVKVNLRGGGNE